MGKVKKIGIGFGVIVGLFFVLVIAAGVSVGMEKANMTPEELAEYEKEQAILNAEKIEEMKILREQQWIEHDEKIAAELEDAKSDAEDLQKIIAGFEAYNKSVKILLDMCGNVESETDFHLLGQLIAEYGDGFIENTSGYGALRDRLMAEGYGEHQVLGPLMNESVMLVDLMSACMEILAWEFSG